MFPCLDAPFNPKCVGVFRGNMGRSRHSYHEGRHHLLWPCNYNILREMADILSGQILARNQILEAMIATSGKSQLVGRRRKSLAAVTSPTRSLGGKT